MPQLTLVSHRLCPYVQRAAISLAEKQVPFQRTYVDLSNKPAWFLALSPLGKVPLLKVGDAVLFESAAILEYLEDITRHPLHPADPVERARHRGWIEFGSAVLNDIAAFYTAKDDAALAQATGRLRAKFERIEAALGNRPWFAGEDFSLVDAVFGPVFRYFDTFDRIGDFGVLTGLPKTAAWRAALAARPSIASAVDPAYPELLEEFLRARHSALSSRMQRAEAA